MTKQKLIDYIQTEYGVEADYPFDKDFESAVFRHRTNKKWFAVLMKVSKEKLGLEGTEKVDILNLKCQPILRVPLLSKKGIYVAYHMNKEHWISLLLNEVDNSDLFSLLDMSFDLTNIKRKPVV